MTKKYSNDFLFSITIPEVLDETFEEDPGILWQHKKNTDNFYLNQLVIEKRTSLIYVLKPKAGFGPQVAKNTTNGQNLLHLASLHCKTPEMFAALKPMLDLAVQETPTLLQSKDTDGNRPLWLALRQNNLLITRYFLEKFAQKHDELPAGSTPRTFRDMFVLFPDNKEQRISLYEVALQNLGASSEMMSLLKYYGLDFYTVEVSVPENAALLPRYNAELFKREITSIDQPSLLFSGKPYWMALINQRIQDELPMSFNERLRLQRFVTSLANEADIHLGADTPRVSHDQQLRDLAVYLESEANSLEDFSAAYSQNFLNKKVRPTIRTLANKDLKNVNYDIKFAFEVLAWGVYFTGFVFWCMYNDQMWAKRTDQISDLRENYPECMYRDTLYKGYHSVNNGCLVAPQSITHSFNCTVDPFQSDYSECYDTALIVIFQTLALMFAAVTFFVPSLNGNVSWRLGLPQAVVKSPLYLARYAIGETKALTSFPDKLQRISVYKGLLDILLSYYETTEQHVVLSAQRDILNKPSAQITLEELQEVLQTVSKSFADYTYAIYKGEEQLIAADLTNVLTELSGLMQFNVRDIERNSVGSVTRLSRNPDGERMSIPRNSMSPHFSINAGLTEKTPLMAKGKGKLTQQ